MPSLSRRLRTGAGSAWELVPTVNAVTFTLGVRLLVFQMEKGNGWLISRYHFRARGVVMLISWGKHICFLAISVCLISLSIMQPANAAVISTQTAIEMGDRQDRIDNINELLAKESVQRTLILYGVESSDAIARVDAMTNSELLTLEQQLQKLPAGGTGVVEVVGIVAIVLVILELLNVTNFFNEF